MADRTTRSGQESRADDEPAAVDAAIAAPIRLLLSDVDGVLTGGQLYFDTAGNEIKQFHVRDGMGIKAWMSAGLEFGIISSRDSSVVARRAAELGIGHLFQGVESKLPVVERLVDELGLVADQVAYIGDDLPDLAVLEWVGLSVAPADACRDVRHSVSWLTECRGGEGAVRELVERLMQAKSIWEGYVRA